MDEHVMERDGERKALGASLLLHLILFLTAAAMGLFSVANPIGKRPPIDVVLYDEGSDAGSSAAGDSAPAAAPVVTVDDIVVQDKNVVPEAVQEQQINPQQNTLRTVQSTAHTVQTGTAGARGSQSGNPSGSASVGTGSGTSTGDSDGTAGLGSAPAPPQERVEASLRAEARPEYPQELIDDDVEGSVTIKILVAADGSVEAVDVASSSGYRAMDRAAVAAGWRFQFNPGDNGRRGVWTKTFRFQLN